MRFNSRQNSVYLQSNNMHIRSATVYALNGRVMQSYQFEGTTRLNEVELKNVLTAHGMGVLQVCTDNSVSNFMISKF